MVGGLPSSVPAKFPLAPSLNLVASIYWHKATQQIKQKYAIKSLVVDGWGITSRMMRTHPATASGRPTPDVVVPPSGGGVMCANTDQLVGSRWHKAALLCAGVSSSSRSCRIHIAPVWIRFSPHAISSARLHSDAWS